MWFETLTPDVSLVFCRLTQLGLLRLLTTAAVMGDEVMTQPQAWGAYDRWHHDPRVELVDEPAELEAKFRVLTRLRQSATKEWADSYPRSIRHRRAADTGHVRERTARESQVNGAARVSPMGRGFARNECPSSGGPAL
jgi:hypothetical protein